MLDANGTNDVGKTTMFMYRLKHDRLGELNQYTGDGAKQKIKTVPAILLDNRMLTANFKISSHN